MKVNKISFFKYLFFIGILFIVLTSVYVGKQAKKNNPENIESKQILSIRGGDHVLGNPDAKIKIIEYGEGECIYCKRLHLILLRVVEENKNDVALIYRHFPLAVHPKSYAEATAFECAAEYGGHDYFWKYLSLFYEQTPSNNNTDLSILPKIASSIGIPEKTFNECLASDRYKKHIQEDLQSGFSLNVDSTPQLFITSTNGDLFIYTKAPSYNMLRTVLDNMLKAGN